MSGRLQDKVAIVTGSNSGIGRAIALAYAREGAKVVCANRSEASKNPAEKDITTHDLIKKNGGEGVYIHVQIADTASVSQLMKDVTQKYGRVDIVVSNAGTGVEFEHPVNLWDQPDEIFETTVDVNLRGSFKILRAATGTMVKQQPLADGSRGRIIMIGSVFGPRGAAMGTSYCATKSAIIAMTKSAAIECAPHGVHVNVINPGTVATNMTADIPEMVRDFLKQKALIGFGKVEDIAGPAVFLASAEGRWMTGSEVNVDGGYLSI